MASRRGELVMALALGLLAWGPERGAAQDTQEQIPGVRLGLVYEATQLPGLAISPFSGRFGGDAITSQVEAIVGRDLRYSDRFRVIDSLPASLGGDQVDYSLWDQLGSDYLVVAQVEGSTTGYVLALEVHDVVYSKELRSGRFPLPTPDSDDFRMAVHRASDAVVLWVTGDPGMAASRIAFSQPTSSGAKEIYVIDSDGENLRRVTRTGSLSLAPTWAPDGRRLTYVSFQTGDARLFELDLVTGRERLIDVPLQGQVYSPSYLPDGRLAFSVHDGASSGLYTYDAEGGCCLVTLTRGRREELSPTYSPDGSRLAFMSNRFGTRTPQIFTMSAGGGDADVISPYEYGSSGYYTSPDWSPTNDKIAFHGRVRRGGFQILVADADGRGARLVQLTSEGRNEDPSWAPDGRHLVFVGERRSGFGLMIVDSGTGRLRTLLPSVRASVPDWSSALPAR